MARVTRLGEFRVEERQMQSQTRCKEKRWECFNEKKKQRMLRVTLDTVSYSENSDYYVPPPL